LGFRSSSFHPCAESVITGSMARLVESSYLPRWILLCPFLIMLCPFLSEPLTAQRLKGGGEGYPELRTNQQALEEWRKLRFGMFIHWGPVALRGTEIGWSRGREVAVEDYDRLYKEFNPVLFDAAEWVRIAKRAGMKYLVLVTKHHDGFTLWDSEHTDYDIMATPFKLDIVGELSQECRRQGLLFGTYYSILDWRHPDYPLAYNRSRPKANAEMDRYLTFLRGQVRELLTRYRTRILWFDGEWEDPWTHRMGMDLYAWIRRLDDSVLVNNRVDKGRSGMEGISRSARFAGDFETPEQRVGSYNPTTPWETCMTLGEQWAWKPNDKLKSLRECVQTLVRTAGGDGNLLLNVGPMLDGRIELRQVELLEKIGRWLGAYGETVYETRGGPFPPQVWGVSTHRKETVYLHVLAAEKDRIEVPDPGFAVGSVRLFQDKSPLEWQPATGGITVKIPPDKTDEIDTVIEIRSAGSVP